jgi:hypothetical protein
MAMKFRRINANLRHIDKELVFQLDLTSVQSEGQSIEAWQETISEIKKIHLKFPDQWYLSYFVAMDVKEKVTHEHTSTFRS